LSPSTAAQAEPVEKDATALLAPASVAEAAVETAVELLGAGPTSADQVSMEEALAKLLPLLPHYSPPAAQSQRLL